MSYECYCEPMESDGYSDVWNITWPVARKEHICCECKDTISKGQKYQRIFSVYEGTVDVFKTCEFCASEFDRLRKKHPDANFCKEDLACVVAWDMRNEAPESP